MQRKLLIPLISIGLLPVTLGSNHGEVLTPTPPPAHVRLVSAPVPSQNSGPTPNGHHEAGCPGRDAGAFISQRAKNLKLKHYYAEIRVSSHIAYVLCRFNRDKVKPKWTETCYSWIHPLHRFMDRFYTGVTINHYAYSPSNGHAVNPYKYKVKNNHKIQACKRSDISVGHEHWLFLNWDRHEWRPNARWKAHGAINFRIDFDPNYKLGPTLFDPARDFRVRAP